MREGRDPVMVASRVGEIIFLLVVQNVQILEMGRSHSQMVQELGMLFVAPIHLVD